MTMDLTPYLDRIRRWNPGLDLSVTRADPYGLNNFVLLVNDELVFRFPRADKGRAALRSEAALLALVRQAVSATVPNVTFDEEQDFVVYPIVPGHPSYRHDLLRWPDAAQAAFAQAIGRFLRQLHAIPPEPLRLLLGEPVEETPDLWSERLAAVRAELYPFLWADQQAWIEDLFAPTQDGRLEMHAYSPCLIHNDLASYHLLSDPATGALTGILDFGSAGWGDPAADLAALISGFGESFLARLGDSYPISPELLERARVRAGYIELSWALKGVRRADPIWYLVHLGRARDVRPFGSTQ